MKKNQKEQIASVELIVASDDFKSMCETLQQDFIVMPEHTMNGLKVLLVKRTATIDMLFKKMQ